ARANLQHRRTAAPRGAVVVCRPLSWPLAAPPIVRARHHMSFPAAAMGGVYVRAACWPGRAPGQTRPERWTSAQRTAPTLSVLLRDAGRERRASGGFVQRLRFCTALPRGALYSRTRRP